MDDPDTNTYVNCETELYSVNADTIESVAKFICTSLGFKSWELSISFVNATEMRSLNSKYRKLDKTTDVLSFPLQEWKEPITVERPFKPDARSTGIPFMLGDLVISLEDAEINAKDIGHSLDREIGFLLVHGILHLCGHDHIEPEDEEIMTGQQQLLMKKMTDDFSSPLWNLGVAAKATSPELQQ